MDLSQDERNGPVSNENENAFGVVVEDDKQAHLDFLTSIILIVISLAVIITSQNYYRQQLARGIVSKFYESTGFMPTVFAGFLLVMALTLLIKAVRLNGLRQNVLNLVQAAKATLHSKKFYLSLGGLAIFAVYIYLLLGRLYFGLASFLVLAAALLYTHPDKQIKTALKMLLIAFLSVAGIVLLFQYAFSVPMP